MLNQFKLHIIIILQWIKKGTNTASSGITIESKMEGNGDYERYMRETFHFSCEPESFYNMAHETVFCIQ